MRYHWLLFPLCLTFSTSRAAADELTFEGRPLTAWVERLRSQDQAGRTDALRAFNDHFLRHEQLEATIVPVGDGLGIGVVRPHG